MAAGFRSLFAHNLGGALTPIVPPTLIAWTLGALWQISVICAKQGAYGLQRTGNGVTSTSDVTSTVSIDVAPGNVLYTAFWAKASLAANGTISLGFAFYDSTGTLLSSSFVDSTGVPTEWTQFVGNITAPPFAATAIPIVRATNHTTGLWCIDVVYAVVAGGNWQLSSLRHFYSDYASYR